MNTEEFKAKLEEEKALLESELGSIGIVGGDKKSNSDTFEVKAESVEDFDQADENEMADRSEDFNERVATGGELYIRLKEINEALDKIDSGTYGLCETCELPIETDRLEANPAAKTCKAHMNN